MSKTIKSALPLLLGNVCILFLLTAGGLFSFLSAYELMPEGPALLLGCGVFSLLFAVLWTVPHGGWAALGLLGLDALAVWRLWERLEPAAKVLRAAVSGDSWRHPVEYSFLQSGAAEALTPALLLLAFTAAFVMGWLAVRERCWHLPAVLLTVPLLAAFLAGVLPDMLPLLAETAGWVTLLLTSLYNRQDTRSLGKAVWISLGGITALLLLLLAALPREGYTRPQWATNAQRKLIQAVTEGFSSLWDGVGDGGGFWNLDFGIPTSSGSEVDGQVDLTKAGLRRYTGSVVLEVTGGTPGRTYLRGGSSAVYTGSGWEALDAAEYENLRYLINHEVGGFMKGSYLTPDGPLAVAMSPEPAVFPAMTVPGKTLMESMTVRHRRTSGDTAYFPYRLLRFPDGLAELSGDGSAVRSMDEYKIDYIPGGLEEETFTPLSGAAAKAEALYRDFVYKHYLYVPSEAAAALGKMVYDHMQTDDVPRSWPNQMGEAYQDYASFALYVAKLLENTAVYDLDVSPMEPDEDFVTHFLEEGRGYCVHFATAGTLLLRMRGIPARYVEGYAPLLGEGEVSEVRDSDAHAWVEIYLDGYGWYPVEMTPGRQGETPDTVAPEILQTEPPEEDEPLEEEDWPEEEIPDRDLETPDSGSESAGGEDSEPEREPLDLGWLWKTAAVLLLLAAPYGGYRLLLLVRKKRREHPDTNRSVIYAYLCYQRLLKRGAPEEAELEELGRKAKFSQHRLTEEERETAWKCVEHAEAERKKQKKLPI